MATTSIKFVQPFSAEWAILRVSCDGKTADFQGHRTGKWTGLSALERDYGFLAAVLDRSATLIAAVVAPHAPGVCK